MKHVPNLLTLLRLVLAPVIVLVYLNQAPGSWWCFGLFFIAGFSDYVDGKVARSTGAITEFGKLFDPIADKLVIGSALILLTIDEVISIWITVIILVREISVTFARIKFIKHGVLAADRGGKLKTMLQGFSLLFLLSPIDLSLAALPMLYLATAITVITGVRFFKQLSQIGITNDN
jgi:CDP-diacylglycerol--glycerol-3-phosphate 3-phosphatidyltransferase